MHMALSSLKFLLFALLYHFGIALTALPPSPECVDIVKNCPALLATHNCEEPTLKKFCPKTCGICQEGERSYVDELMEMESESTIGQLTTSLYLDFKELPKEGVALAVNSAPLEQRTKLEKNACEDISPNCAANAFQCKYNTYVQQKCQKTCGLCKKIDCPAVKCDSSCLDHQYPIEGKDERGCPTCLCGCKNAEWIENGLHCRCDSFGFTTCKTKPPTCPVYGSSCGVEGTWKSICSSSEVLGSESPADFVCSGERYCCCKPKPPSCPTYGSSCGVEGTWKSICSSSEVLGSESPADFVCSDKRYCCCKPKPPKCPTYGSSCGVEGTWKNSCSSSEVLGSESPADFVCSDKRYCCCKPKSTKSWNEDRTCANGKHIHWAPNGKLAECNPKGNSPCCSNWGWCGNTDAHCKCDTCIDYRVPDECVDISTKCTQYAHQCQSSSFVQGRCKKTCGLCAVTPAPDCPEVNCDNECQTHQIPIETKDEKGCPTCVCACENAQWYDERGRFCECDAFGATQCSYWRRPPPPARSNLYNKTEIEMETTLL